MRDQKRVRGWLDPGVIGTLAGLVMAVAGAAYVVTTVVSPSGPRPRPSAERPSGDLYRLGQEVAVDNAAAVGLVRQGRRA